MRQVDGLLAKLSLAWVLAKQDLTNRYANSYAGVVWTIGVPLLYAIINVMVFSILMSGRMGERYGDIPFALFYFVPLSIWIFFAEMTSRSTNILREYSYLINKIAFPFWILPLVPILSALISQAIILAITAGLLAYHGIGVASSIWVYVVVCLIGWVLTLGVCYASSALAMYIPDLGQIVPIAINIIFWLTPILYPATLVEADGPLWVRSIIMDWNPFFYLVETARHAFFGTAAIAWSALAGVATLAVVVFVAGLGVFKKLKPGFADVI